MYEYTLKLTSEQAKEIEYAVELLMRWKLKQENIVTWLLLNHDEESSDDQSASVFCRKRDAMTPALKAAMDIQYSDKNIHKDHEWHVLYNIFQSVRKAIHDAEHPWTEGVDSYPPIDPLDIGIPACTWKKTEND